MVDILPVQGIQDHVKSSRIPTKEDRRSSNNSPGVRPVGRNKDHRYRASGETNTVDDRGERAVVLGLHPKGNLGDVYLVRRDSLGQKVRQEDRRHLHSNDNSNLHHKEDDWPRGILRRSKGEILIHLHTQGGLTVTKLYTNKRIGKRKV